MDNVTPAKEKIFGNIRKISLIISGTAILAFGNIVFMLPFDIVSGGIFGLSIVLEKIISISFLTTESIVTILTWLSFFLGYFILGKSFTLKTLISTIAYPVFISLFSVLTSEDFLSGYFFLNKEGYEQIGVLIASVAGGVFVGIGCALTFLGGGSTGGTDILAFAFCKYSRKFKTSEIIFIIDAAIVILGMFIIKDFIVSLLGILSAFICVIVIDKIFGGNSRAFTAQIISDNYEDINSEIIKKLGRTTTIIYAKGGFTSKERKIIIFSFTISEYADVINIVNSADKNAFITINRAHEINGNGWPKKQ